jgi:hypothetical protein
MPCAGCETPGLFQVFVEALQNGVVGINWASDSYNAMTSKDCQQVAQSCPNLTWIRLHAPRTFTTRQVVLNEVPEGALQIAKIKRSSAAPVREVRNAAEVDPRGSRSVLPRGQMINVRGHERREDAVAQPCC